MGDTDVVADHESIPRIEDYLPLSLSYRLELLGVLFSATWAYSCASRPKSLSIYDAGLGPNLTTRGVTP